MSWAGGLVTLFKQGCNSYPEIMAAGCHAILGCIVIVGVNLSSNKEDYLHKKYRNRPKIMRPDDPRVLKIIKTSVLDSYP